jgi:hypothetical protein
MSNFIESLVDGDVEEFRKNIFDTLYAKAYDALNEKKSSTFSRNLQKTS